MAASPCFTSSALSTPTNTTVLTPRLSCRLILSIAFAGSGAISGVFTDSGWRHGPQGTRPRRSLHELGERGNAAIDAAFHRAVEHEVALVVREGVFRELRGRLEDWRRRRRRHGGPLPRPRRVRRRDCRARVDCSARRGQRWASSARAARSSGSGVCSSAPAPLTAAPITATPTAASHIRERILSSLVAGILRCQAPQSGFIALLHRQASSSLVHLRRSSGSAPTRPLSSPR